MEYIAIPKATFDSYNLNKEHILTADEMLKITVYKDLLAKFIRQKAVAIQFDIGLGQCKGEETIYLKVVEILEKFAEDISKSEKVYNEYLMQIEEIKKKEEGSLK